MIRTTIWMLMDGESHPLQSMISEQNDKLIGSSIIKHIKADKLSFDSRSNGWNFVEEKKKKNS